MASAACLAGADVWTVASPIAQTITLMIICSGLTSIALSEGVVTSLVYNATLVARWNCWPGARWHRW